MKNNTGIPEVLKKPLVFGDVGQIDALREMEKDYIEKHGDGTKKRFAVYIDVEYSDTEEVLAMSAREAEEMVEDDFLLSSISDMLDITFTAREIKEKP